MCIASDVGDIGGGCVCNALGLTTLPTIYNLSLCAELCLQSLSEREGWTAKDDTFFLRNQEEHIKPKKIITRIEFDSE